MQKPFVMVVDDAEASRQALAALLSAHHPVLEARCTEDALELAHQHSGEIALVFLAANGAPAALGRLREDEALARVPAIAILDNAASADAEASAYASGAVDVLRQPLRPDVVLGKTKNLMALRAQWGGFVEAPATPDQPDQLDPLTGLLTMPSFIAHADAFLEKLEGEEWRAYRFVYGNIRNFRYFNANYGTERGDELLREFAQMIKEDPDNVLCAHFGQDHMVTLTKKRDLAEDCARTSAEFAREHAQYGMAVEAGAYRLRSAEDRAYKACEFAKLACDSLRGSQHTFREFDDSLERHALVSEHVLRSLDEAIAAGQIEVHYQPVVRCLTGSVCSLEALSRWHDPSWGWLSPADFVPALEDAGLIHKLDQHVIRTVCQAIRQRLDEGKAVVPVSLNLSRMDFLKLDVVGFIERTVRESGIARDLVILEVTESIAMSDQHHICSCVDRLRSLGYQVWMDDFGSEYSSLTVLQNFNFDEIKLDRAFLANPGPKSEKVIRSVIAMAKTMGISTLAEGVETQEQMDFLRSIGCDKAQGFLISRPQPSEALEDLIRSRGHHAESRVQMLYYDRLSTVDFMTEKAMAICECDGEDLSVLFTNEAFDETWRHGGFGDFGQIITSGRYKESDFWHAYIEHLHGIRRDDTFYSMDYSHGNVALKIRSRRIAQRQSHMLFQLELEVRGTVSTDIRDIVDVRKLEEAMRAWSTACDMATVCLGANGEFVTGEVGFVDFCKKHTRMSPLGRKRCLECDCYSKGVYRCHAGLIDFGFDITLNTGQVVGRIVGGQVLPEPVDEKRVRTLAEELGLPAEEYLAAARKVPVRDMESIEASAHLLCDIVNGLVNAEYSRTLQEKYLFELDDLARRDSLTGLYNNAFCTNRIDTLIFERKPFSICMFDLDGFKRVNDTYGHSFGNRALATLAQALREAVSDNVVVGRVGGDQFALIAPTTCAADEEELAQVARDCLASVRFDDTPGFGLSAGMGMASYPRDGKTAKSLYGVADAALYAEKHARRD